MISFSEKIEREFGKGVTLRGLSKAEKNVAELKGKTIKFAERLQRDHDRYKNNPTTAIMKEVEESTDLFEKAQKEYEDAKQALYSGEVFGDKLPAETIGLIPCEGEISLADLYDIRYETDNKVARVVLENYNDISTADIVAEGSKFAKSNIEDHLSAIATDKNNILKVGKILNVSENMFADDEALLNGAIDSVQHKHLKNAETKILCDTVQASKEAIEVTGETLNTFVNNNLCGKAKIKAEIITNESGFAKLDITDEKGTPLVKKNFEVGEFIYKDRYIIRVLSDNTLKNDENNNSPVLVGDWRNILRLVMVMKYPPLVKDNLFDEVIENRAVEKIIPLLTTTSDEAFIVCKLA